MKALIFNTQCWYRRQTKFNLGVLALIRSTEAKFSGDSIIHGGEKERWVWHVRMDVTLLNLVVSFMLLFVISKTGTALKKILNLLFVGNGMRYCLILWTSDNISLNFQIKIQFFNRRVKKKQCLEILKTAKKNKEIHINVLITLHV